MQPTVSIIIPVYNASNFMDKCLDSLSKQTLDNLEFIFIDDHSTDDSVDKLKHFIQTTFSDKSNIQLILHSENKGSATARNTGLSVAKGKYVAFIDIDDWMHYDMLKTFYEKAELEYCDIVWCDFYLEFVESTLKKSQTFNEDAKLFAQALISGDMQGMLWNKLFRKSLIDQYTISFLDGANMAEDRNFLFKALCFSKKISYIAESYYHYNQKNTSSITRDFRSLRVYEEIRNAEDMMNFITKNKIDWIAEESLTDFKFRVKKKLLFSTSIEDFKNWRTIFPTSNSHYLKSNLTVRHKILAYLAIHKNWFLINVWNKLKTIKSQKSTINLKSLAK